MQPPLDLTVHHQASFAVTWPFTQGQVSIALVPTVMQSVHSMPLGIDVQRLQAGHVAPLKRVRQDGKYIVFHVPAWVCKTNKCRNRAKYAASQSVLVIALY